MLSLNKEIKATTAFKNIQVVKKLYKNETNLTHTVN